MRHFHLKHDWPLCFLCLFFLTLSLAFLFKISPPVSAEDTTAHHPQTARFVTIYNKGQKLTIKTSATTVAEALSRAKIVIDETDRVEPSLEDVINADNFYINIYPASPAIIIDGAVTKHTMTASRDPRVIAQTAGLTVYDGDTIELIQSDRFLEAGATPVYQIIRHGGTTLTVYTELAFEEQKVKDFTIEAGTTKVLQLGEIGQKATTYNIQYLNGKEVTRELVSEIITRPPVPRIVAVGASPIEMKPLTRRMGRNYYTINGIERQETYYDLNMFGVMPFCGQTSYSVRAEDGVKVDPDGYVIVAANLDRYPRCSVVQTSLGMGKVYDTGSFAETNPEQFDIATNWTRHLDRWKISKHLVSIGSRIAKFSTKLPLSPPTRESIPA